MPAPVGSPLSPLLRDFAAGLKQQMFFWGKDAAHPEGNLFVRTGFEKRPSTGLKGTSCYRLAWQSGAIELHGSHAGWLTDEGGVFFVRPISRCVRWLDGTPPVPGQYPRDRYSPNPDANLHTLARPFLDWWLAHESQVQRLAGDSYREACYRHYKRLPRSRAWLRPGSAMRWIRGLRDHPQELPRARRFDRDSER